MTSQAELFLADLPNEQTHNPNMPTESPNNYLLKAIELAQAGDWNAAHELVQQHEDNTAAWKTKSELTALVARLDDAAAKRRSYLSSPSSSQQAPSLTAVSAPGRSASRFETLPLPS